MVSALVAFVAHAVFVYADLVEAVDFVFVRVALGVFVQGKTVVLLDLVPAVHVACQIFVFVGVEDVLVFLLADLWELTAFVSVDPLEPERVEVTGLELLVSFELALSVSFELGFREVVFAQGDLVPVEAFGFVVLESFQVFLP